MENLFNFCTFLFLSFPPILRDFILLQYHIRIHSTGWSSDSKLDNEVEIPPVLGKAFVEQTTF